MTLARGLGFRRAVYAAVASLLISGCSNGAGLSSFSPEITLKPSQGILYLTHQNQTKRVWSPRTVVSGDKLVLSEGATASLSFGSSTNIEILSAIVRIAAPAKVVLDKGSLLAQTSGRLVISMGPLQASGTQSTFRVDKGLGIRVADYSGRDVSISQGGDSLGIPAYRQAVVAGGIFPRSSRPLYFAASDPWDRRLLADALDLDARLSNFGNGLEAQLAAVEGQGLLDGLFPELAVQGALDSLAANRSSDKLIGLSIALEAQMPGQDLKSELERIFAAWNQGASWGLIAQQYGVKPEALLARLSHSLDSSQVKVIGATLGKSGSTVPGRKSGSQGSGSTGGSTQRSQSLVPGNGQAQEPGLLPQPISQAVPGDVKSILNDLLGVVQPIATVPKLAS